MLYIPNMSIVTNYQQRVLKSLAGKIDDFYLAGGTALSAYYFHHRESVDLDFFTHKFAKLRIEEVAGLISQGTNKKIELSGQELRKNMVKIAVYNLVIDKRGTILKIDFVEDYIKLIKPLKLINGINILSLEDIFLRKLFAITGTSAEEDMTGRRIAKGGRQEAKDFYDLFCLSQIFMRLSDFADKYGNPLIREAIIRWFRTYDRFNIKTGLLELNLKKSLDYNEIERHFTHEVDKLIEQEVD